MRRPVLLAFAVAVSPAWALAQDPSNNQQPSGTSSPQSQTGSSSAGSGSGGSASFGSMNSGSGSGSSLFGNASSRLGGSGGSGGGTGAAAGQATQPFEFGQFGQALSNIGFVGGANANGFVGNRAANQQTGQGASQQAFQGFSRGGNGFSNGQSGGASRPKLGIRPTQRIAFAAPLIAPAVATTRASASLTRIVDRRPELAGITATTDDAGRLVLRGTVASEEARDLAAALVRLEPGVGVVVNELAVPTEPAP